VPCLGFGSWRSLDVRKPTFSLACEQLAAGAVTGQAEGSRLVRWSYTRTWLNSEQPSVLFDLAIARLVEQQVLLPGVSILVRLGRPDS